jgi:hypothetical protein
MSEGETTMTANVAIYAPGAQPITAQQLRQLAPGAQLAAARGRSGAVERYRVEWGDVRVDLSLVPPGELSEHLGGFQSYVRRVTGEDEGEAVNDLLDRIGAVQLVHGVVVEPDFDAAGKAHKLILDLLKHYGALLFAGGAVYNEKAELLLGPARAEEEDEEGEEEEWEPTPNQLERAERSRALLRARQVPLYRGPLFTEDDDAVQLREPAEVARRALVLWAVAQRGEWMSQEEARGLIERAGVWDAVSAEEQAFLDEPNPAPEVAGRFVWRLEALWVLLWALGHLEELGWPEGFCDVPRLSDLMRAFEDDPEFIRGAQLRPAGEVLDAQDLTLRIHWAIRDAWLNKRPIPADLDWSGDAERLRVEKCPPVGVVEQRHATLNWLVCFGGDDWDHIDTPT